MHQLGYEFKRCHLKTLAFKKLANRVTKKTANQCVKRAQNMRYMFTNPNYKVSSETNTHIIGLQQILLATAFNMLQGTLEIIPDKFSQNCDDKGFTVGSSIHILEHVLLRLETKDEERVKSMGERLDKLRRTCYISNSDRELLSELQSEALDLIFKCIELKCKNK